MSRLGSGYNALSIGANDLYKTRLSTNPWYGAGSTVSSTQLPYRAGESDPWAYLAASLAKGLLGGAMSGYGSESEEARHQDVQRGIAQALMSENPAAAFESNAAIQPLAGQYAAIAAAEQAALEQQQQKDANSLARTLASKGMTLNPETGGYSIDPGYVDSIAQLESRKAQERARFAKPSTSINIGERNWQVGPGETLNLGPEDLAGSGSGAETPTAAGSGVVELAARQEIPIVSQKIGKEIAAKVPPVARKEAYKELAEVENLLTGFSELDRVYDGFARIKTLGANLPLTKAQQEWRALESEVNGILQKIIPGAPAVKEIEAMTKGLLPKTYATSAQIEEARVGMLNMALAKRGSTPYLNTYGIKYDLPKPVNKYERSQQQAEQAQPVPVPVPVPQAALALPMRKDYPNDAEYLKALEGYNASFAK